MSEYDSLKPMITKLSYSTNENFIQKTPIFLLPLEQSHFLLPHDILVKKGFSPSSLSSFI